MMKLLATVFALAAALLAALPGISEAGRNLNCNATLLRD